MKKINILITSIGKKLWLCKLFLAAIPKFDTDITLYVADSNKLAPAMLGMGESRCIYLPSIESPFFYSELRKTIEQFGINLIIPTIDSELELLATLPITLGCSIDFIKLALDKYLTYQEWLKHDIPTPYTVTTADILENCHESNNQEYFVKPRFGGTGIRARKFFGHHKLRELCRLEPDLIVQEIMSGEEFSIDILFLDNRFVHCHPRIRRTISGGEAVTCHSFNKEKLEPSLSRLISWLESKGANGMLNVQGFISVKGITYTEVNPRIASGFMHSYVAGAYYPEAILAEVSGEAIPKFMDSVEDTTTIKISTVKIVPGKFSW